MAQWRMAGSVDEDRFSPKGVRLEDGLAQPAYDLIQGSMQ
jgi:hypothetical protein